MKTRNLFCAISFIFCLVSNISNAKTSCQQPEGIHFGKDSLIKKLEKASLQFISTQKKAINQKKAQQPSLKMLGELAKQIVIRSNKISTKEMEHTGLRISFFDYLKDSLKIDEFPSLFYIVEVDYTGETNVSVNTIIFLPPTGHVRLLTCKYETRKWSLSHDNVHTNSSDIGQYFQSSAVQHTCAENVVSNVTFYGISRFENGKVTSKVAASICKPEYEQIVRITTGQ